MEKRLMQLLVIDDDELVRDSIELALPDHWEMTSGQSIDDCEGFYHAAFVDVHLTGNMAKTEGIDVMRHLTQSLPHLEVVAMSGDLNRDIMESALKAGASRFLAKPLSMEELVLVLDKIEALWQLRGVQASNDKEGIRWIGESSSSENVKKFVASMTGEKAPLLVEGESGTGKEVVAQLLHKNNKAKPFVAVNVAAISENLFESEFFGHVKGAFTGAVQNKVGYVELAHGGDLFLDEIEALSPNHQAKLLRFLESGEYQKVGSHETARVDVRVIAATNESLEELVEKEKFREDLLYRLSGHKLKLPPLRERREDIKDLCQHFLDLRGSMKKMIDDEAVEVLKTYSWPGNVRQLKRVCERLGLLAPLPVIRAEDVKNVLFGETQKVENTSFSLDKGLGSLMEAYEKSVLQFALEQTEDVEELAKTLKISRSSLYKKIKDHDLEIKK